MSRIQLLSEEIASQVAAGEVVERPASVVKELVENSLDAQASQVEVLIKRGGSALVRVVDNGIGMDRDDALLCLERHATSKIRKGEDLFAISTLGFRGEALPSIASVSRFNLSTREHGALAGTEVVVNGGRVEAVRDSGTAPGTQIEVRQLFYNLPARRKFLRSENTEASHVQNQLQLQAIGHPGVGFVFVNDDRLVYQLPPVAGLRDRIRDICGKELADQLLEVEADEIGGMRLHGFIGKPGVSRSTRSEQITFVNGRAVENIAITRALREGYHTALMKGQYPVTFLFVEMDPAAVDVNVHPAKREVRFRDSFLIRERIVDAVRRAIESGRGEWSRTFFPGSPSGFTPSLPEEAPQDIEIIRAPSGPAVKPLVPNETLALIPETEQVSLRRDWSSIAMAPAPAATRTADPAPAMPQAEPAPQPGSVPSPESTETPAVTPDRTQDFRILGVLGKLYVLMENASGLVVVDQHAAHERILFEELRRRMETQGVPTQRLLMPLTFQASPRDADWISQNADTLQKMGIWIEPFGAGTFKIDALPQFLRGSDPLQIVRSVLDELRQTSTNSSRLRLGEDVIAKTVCRHAVKANDYLREPELVKLIQDLLACELPYCCPHGRPTMVQMSYLELEKKFGRKV